MALQTIHKSRRTQQRHRKQIGHSRPVGRPRAALDSTLMDMYVKVTRRELTMQEAADMVGCTIRTLQRHFKSIRQRPYDYHTQRETETRAQ